MKTQLILLSVISAIAQPVMAQDSRERPDQNDKSVYSVVVENDLFADTDRHYTNGLRLSRLRKVDSYSPASIIGSRLIPDFDDSTDVWLDIGVGQSIYTPEDIDRINPAPLDRPYAGYLHLDLGLVAKAGSRLDQVVVSLGTVGPAALGKEVQNGFHNFIDKDEANGWANQIPNEPILNLTYRRSQRVFAAQAGYFDIDFTPHIGGAIGNANAHLSAGGMVRFGSDLPDDFGPPRIGPSLPGSGYFKPQDNIGWYIFAGIDGRAVAHDIFLDGALFSGGPSVKKKDFVGDFQTGLVVSIGDMRVGYTHIFRSKEFVGQSESDQFGAFSVSFRY